MAAIFGIRLEMPAGSRLAEKKNPRIATITPVRSRRVWQLVAAAVLLFGVGISVTTLVADRGLDANNAGPTAGPSHSALESTTLPPWLAITYLDQLPPANGSLGEFRSVTIAGKNYQNSFLTRLPLNNRCNQIGSVHYNLTKNYQSLEVGVGIDDRSATRDLQVAVFFTVDGKIVLSKQISNGNFVPIALKVEGVRELEISWALPFPLPSQCQAGNYLAFVGPKLVS
jgi:hypothetical protein